MNSKVLDIVRRFIQGFVEGTAGGALGGRGCSGRMHRNVSNAGSVPCWETVILENFDFIWR